MITWQRNPAAKTHSDAQTDTYRTDRGEPRGAYRKGQPWVGRGLCIDCNQCVAACPMGIDIRDGLQLECINCALCIDACDDVMVRIGQPKGLIAYDTDANVQRRLGGEKARFRFIRPRTVFYAVVLAVVSTIMVAGLSTRRTVDLDVLRDRNPNFVTLTDGAVRNAYTLKLMNRFGAPRALILSVSEVKAQRINVIGLDNASPPVRLAVEADKVRSLRVLVSVARKDLHGGSQLIRFALTDAASGETRSVDTVFVSGTPQ